MTTIYEHKTTLTVTAGSMNSTTLKISGGIMKQLLVRANTLTTVFKVDLQDNNSKTRLNYDFHEGELNDIEHELPLVGAYTINITNVSPSDTFDLILSVKE